MSEVDSLIKEKDNSISTIYMRFVLLSEKNGDKVLYYFVEGYDAPYYNERIKMLWEYEAIPVKCHGKANVLKICRLLKSKSEYVSCKTAFFVDKDFDCNIDIDEDVYVTPCYSIENLYANSSTLANILKCEFDVLPLEEKHTTIINFFEKEQASFHYAVLEFNAWYFCAKNHQDKSVIDLDDNFPRGFLSLNIGNIKKKYNLDTIKKRYPKSPNITEYDIEKAILSFENFQLSLRGKYELQFFCKFLTFLIEDANVVTRRYFLKNKTTFQINRMLVISQLSQYALTPPCLRKYILERAA